MRIVALGVVLCLASFSTPSHAEACKSGVCVSSKTDGRWVIVKYRTTANPVTHINVRGSLVPPNTPFAPSQGELKPSGKFKVWIGSGYETDYQVQVCNRGTFGSKCLPWGKFRHHVTPGV